MCWGSKWHNTGIRKKIMFSNIFGIAIGFIILHIALVAFSPKIYLVYRTNTLNKKVDNLINKLELTRFKDINEKLDDFTYENDLMMTINDEQGNVIYTSLRDGYKIPDEYHLKGTKSNIVRLNIDKSFYFNQIDKECNIAAHIPIRAEEIRTIIRVFLPFAIISTLIISVITAIFFSRVISKPLIEIIKKADSIAKLDFSSNFYIRGKDEIGELSSSLDIMKNNLSTTIEKLEDANEQLKIDLEKELNAEKERREFLAIISHELKSPITIISGQVQGMIHGIGRYKDKDKYLREVYEVTRTMEGLVREIIDLSRHSNNQFNLDIRYINISDLIQDILEKNYYFSEKKKINVCTSIENNVFICGDKKLLGKAFNNVIKNAFQHSPRGGEVSITLDNKGLKVKNTGVEIPKDDIEKVFNAFYRVDKSRNNKTGGSGLGLYIVYSILEKHNSIRYNIESRNNYVLFNIEFI
jgi:two-component system sensor histidine kinase VanS